MRLLFLILMMTLLTGCNLMRSTTEPVDPQKATIFGIWVGNPETSSVGRLRDQPVTKLILVGIDHRQIGSVRIIQDRWSAPTGRHVLSILAEDQRGQQTVSFLAVDLGAGERYRLSPVQTETGIFAELIDLSTGLSLGTSSPEYTRLRPAATDVGP